MQTLENQRKLAKHILRLLKVYEIVLPIGRTNKGNLGIKFTENSDDFEVMLDAVPLSMKDILADDNNIELKKMLEKYLFDSEQSYADSGKLDMSMMNSITDMLPSKEIDKKRARPAKKK